MINSHSFFNHRFGKYSKRSKVLAWIHQIFLSQIHVDCVNSFFHYPRGIILQHDEDALPKSRYTKTFWYICKMV